MSRDDRLALAHAAGALALPSEGRVVVLRAAPSAFLQEIPAERLVCEQSFRPTFERLVALGHPTEPEVAGPAALVVVNLTRSRAASLGDIARGLAMLDPGGMLAINGAKTEGVDAVVRQVRGALPVEDVFVKAHGRVIRLRRPEAFPEAVADWAADAALSQNAAGFLTAPGMFSPEGPDPGSRMLAASIGPEIAGRVADLGAGWGWLAHAALARAPKIIEIALFEAEARALDAARANLPDPRARFHWADVTTLAADAGPFDWVVCNPPFHTGRAAEPDLGADFIAAAARILGPQGRLLLVANRQLPYEAPLDRAFTDVERLSETAGYKLFRAGRPRRR